jgi:hypothetical protein
MNPVVKIGTYAAGLAVVFGAAFAVGAAVGPQAADAPAVPHVSTPSSGEGAQHGH